MSDKPLTGCIVSAILLIISPFVTLLYGLYLKMMWGWFMILPPITWAQAVGLALLIYFIKIKHIEGDKGWKDLFRAFFTVQVSYALAVLIAWLFWLCGFGNHA